MPEEISVSELDVGSLEERLAETKQALFNLRFQNATGSLDNTAALKHNRRQVARITTELRAREIEAAEALAAKKEHA